MIIKRINKRFGLLYASGMTLTEIMIVMLVIVALVLIGLVSFRSQVFKGTDAKRKAEVRRIGLAAEEYEKDHECYPLPNLVACDPGTGLRPYMDRVPCDPDTKASYYYEHEDSACPKWYRVYTKLTNEDDSDSMGPIGPNGAFTYVYTSPNAPSLEGGGENPPGTTFYGCQGGVCVPIMWDPDRPGPACDPNFQNATCYGACSQPSSECQPWSQ